MLFNEFNGWWDINMLFGGVGGKGIGWGCIGGMYMLYDMIDLCMLVIYIGD